MDFFHGTRNFVNIPNIYESTFIWFILFNLFCTGESCDRSSVDIISNRSTDFIRAGTIYSTDSDSALEKLCLKVLSSLW